MSLDLYQKEANERLAELPPVQNVDPGIFDGFIRGSGMATMQGFAKTARAVDMLGALGPIIQDAFTNGTEAQDRYFKEHDDVFGRAVDYWTPNANEVGFAGSAVGMLASMIPQIFASPGLAVAGIQLGTAEDLVKEGVSAGKAQAVGGVYGAGTALGIWMPILGANLWQRVFLGGAAFNVAQGTAMRGAAQAILGDTEQAKAFQAFNWEEITLDVLMGMAFGGVAHLSPAQQAHGHRVVSALKDWAQNLKPSDKAAIATLREAQHLNVDSTPGTPAGTLDIEAHVERMRAAIDQLATDQPVNIEDIKVPPKQAEDAPEVVQLKQELDDAQASRDAALQVGDQETANVWNKEIERINTDLDTARQDQPAEPPKPTDPVFTPDPERIAEAEATMRDMVADAEAIRVEEGLAPVPEEPARMTEPVRQSIERQLVEAGRPAEEAAAGAAIWDAFYNTMAKRLNTTAEDLWGRFPLSKITREMPGEEALQQPLKQGVKDLNEVIDGRGKRDTWYKSALGDAIDTLNMKSAPSKGWLDALKGMIGKGVKADEIKWSGIEEWLQLQEGRITKEQVRDFLKNNGVKVEEVMLGKKASDPEKQSALESQIDDLNQEQSENSARVNQIDDLVRPSLSKLGSTDRANLPWWVKEAAEGNAESKRKLDVLNIDKATIDLMKEQTDLYARAAEIEDQRLTAARQLRDLTDPEGNTKFGSPDLVLPGGENYREIALTLPGKEIYRAPAGHSMGEAADVNRLAHIRFNERTDAEGKKVLFIEEFQSDWAQKGKKEGFKPSAADAKVEQYKSGGSMKWQVLDEADRLVQNGFQTEAEARQWFVDNGTDFKSKIPTAPFVGKTDAWVALSLKRMIAYAAENGFDKVAWTKGEQQVERYTGALRNAVDEIQWTKTDKGVQLVGYKGARKPQFAVMGQNNQRYMAFDTREQAQAFINGYDEATRGFMHIDDIGPTAGQKVVDTTEQESALSDAIGKAMAEKIINDPNQSGSIEGENIRIDSTGMAGFYDRIVPKVANEVLKKLGGGKVGEIGLVLDTPVETDTAMHQADTARLRELNGMNNRGELNRQQFRELEELRRQRGDEYTQKPIEHQQQGFAITPGMKAAVEGGLPLFQKTKGSERGYMSSAPEGKIIGLLENADASTFVHESGHFFLDTLADIGRLEDTPPEVRADLNTALEWMGVKDTAKWSDMTLDEKRPFHEKFARGFEQYLREGKAPSEELKGVFRRFRDWLVELYKSAKSLNVKLNDDIRGVLNRMLADQVRNPSTEAPPAPADGAGPPPPPRATGEAQAGAEVPLIEQPVIRTILQGMADEETGWAQIGGKLMDQSELGTGKPSFTTWIPKAEWWRERPDKKMNGPGAQEAVRKALAGEKLKPIEQRIVDHMVTLADERSRGLDQVGGEEEYQALGKDAFDTGLEPTTENVVDLDLVARAAALDEAAVERAAMQYGDDDAAFRGAMEMIIHENQPKQQGTEAARGGQEGGGEAEAIADPIRAAADRAVADHPDMNITVGTDAEGNPITIKAKDYLDQARADAQQAREDMPLFEMAAECLLGNA